MLSQHASSGTSSDATRRRRTGWLTLGLAPGLGPRRVAALCEAVDSPSQLADLAAAGALADVPGLSPRAAAWLRTAVDGQAHQAVDRALAWAAMPGHTLVCLDEPGYPPLLRQIPDPPPVLFVRGQAALLVEHQLGVVGSRGATPAGLRVAGEFAAQLVAAGLVVTSGLALGVDAAAHTGALRAGVTIAVLAHGLDQVYPRRNTALAARILDEGGAIVSEMAPAEPVTRQGFPRRNRIIAGLALGVLVVEANVRSGSLITARLAGEFGREVMAVPGVAGSAAKRGCHALLRDGALLVESAADVLEGLGWAAMSAQRQACCDDNHGSLESTSGHRQVPVAEGAIGGTQGSDSADAASLDALAGAELKAQELAVHLGLPLPAVTAALTRLELAGRVARLADNRFQRLK